jgi:transposase
MGTTPSTSGGHGADGGVSFTVLPRFLRWETSYNGSMKKATEKLITIEEKEYNKLIQLPQQVAELQAKLQWYEEQFRLSKQRQYGTSSEKSSSYQLELPLFNEAEVSEDPVMPEPTVETITTTRKKRRGQRQAKLENLPTETVEYQLPETEQVCSCCQGKLHAMSTEVRQELKVIPAEVKVVQHVRHVYACRHCEREGIKTPITTASMPAPVYSGSLASPSAMAHVLHQKYVEGLPLYRQEKQWERFGVMLSRQTMANWVIYGANTWLHPLFERMAFHLRKQDILHADETTLQVLTEPDRAATSKSYMWLYRTGRESPPIVLYEYQPTRKGQHPKQFLGDFQGYLHVDGYAGYNRVIENRTDITLVGCWAHARRKFEEARKALPASVREKKEGIAYEGLSFCNQLFSIERTATERKYTPKERYAFRLKHSQPILDAFSAWIRMQTPNVLPQSALGKAVQYCQNQWKRLTAFLADGRLEIDNNRGERSIKPFVIGRKNWLFANSIRGANASAIVYSVVETAKENGLHPFHYLTYLFEELPQLDIHDPSLLDTFLPWADSLPDRCRVPK